MYNKLQNFLFEQSQNKKWYIGVYVRLSIEDGNDESLSVINQKKIILEYLENNFEKENYEIFNLYVDDGLTGTNVERPNFQKMVSDAKNGLINCIICKNLSRAFRNYSDQGYYLEKIFPKYNIRFISISNPKIDSFLSPEALTSLEIPINGIINDRYAAKTSIDTRTTFATKRRKGEYLSNFPPYGYLKSPENKNKLIIDKKVAPIVKNIFEWFVNEGLSKRGIAKRLNSLKIMNPTTYKRTIYPTYTCRYSNKENLWYAPTIKYILRNQLYVGDMVQGKTTTISYKVHDKIRLPRDKWIVVKNTHEPIISRELFEKAFELTKKRTRELTKEKILSIFAGHIRCNDCKFAMSRHKVKNYIYYYCSAYVHQSGKFCTKHTIRLEHLEQAVLQAIKSQIKTVTNFSKVIEEINNKADINTNTQILSDELKQKNAELKKSINVVDNLYVDWKSNDITREEYLRLKASHQKLIEKLKLEINELEEKQKSFNTRIDSNNEYIKKFSSYKNINSLNRQIIVDLIDCI